jgi:hypothetical protein
LSGDWADELSWLSGAVPAAPDACPLWLLSLCAQPVRAKLNNVIAPINVHRKAFLFIACSSRDNNRVSWLEDDVLVDGLAFDQALVVYWDFLLAPVSLAQNINAFRVRELREPCVG